MKTRPEIYKILLWGGSVILAVAVVLAALVYFVLVPKVRMQAEERGIDIFQIQAAATSYLESEPNNVNRIFVQYDELIGPGRPYLSRVGSAGGADCHELFPIRRGQEEYAITFRDGRRMIVLFGVPGVEGRRWVCVRRTADGKITNPYGKEVDSSSAMEVYQRWLAEEKRIVGAKIVKLPKGRWFEIAYRDGVPHGPFKAFYRDGKLWGEATYENGKPVGLHRVFDRAGKVLYEVDFSADRQDTKKPGR